MNCTKYEDSLTHVSLLKSFTNEQISIHCLILIMHFLLEFVATMYFGSHQTHPSVLIMPTEVAIL